MASLQDICTRKTVVATPDTTVAEAAQLMRRHHVGTIVVCKEAGASRRIPLGIVTDRDIVVEVVAPDLRPDTITVGDIMGRELATVSESKSVQQALEIMRHKGVRRLPVVKDSGRLSGIVSLDDLLGVVAQELNDVAKVAAREQAREAATRR